jgi:RNA polymerase sigma factor (sigma-70 family)
MPLLHPAPPLDDVSDAELISRVRAGDVGSYGTLFARHREAANRLARSLTQPADAEDVVADAFAKVLTALQDGKGPDEAFRPYLLTAVRTCHIDRCRFAARMTPTDDDHVLDTGATFVDPAVAGFEGGAAVEAFRSLPERWQLVLWHLDVEGQKPAAVAPLLGMAPNAVSALAYRAREGLREAFLQQHAAEAQSEECRRTHGLLGAAVRGNLSHRDRKRVEAHLDQCRPCTALYLELTDVNSSLRGLVAPFVLGGTAAAYLAGTTGAGAGVAGGVAGVTHLLGRARDAVTGNTQTALAAGAAAAAAAAAVTGMVLLHTDVGHSGRVAQADTPITVGPPSAAPHPLTSGPGNTPPPRHRTSTAAHSPTAPGRSVAVPAVGLGPATAVSGGRTPGPGRPSSANPPRATDGGSHHPGTANPGTTNPGAPAPGTPEPAPSGADSATVAVSAGVLPGAGDAPVRLGVELGSIPAAHLLSLDLDLLGQHLPISLP